MACIRMLYQVFVMHTGWFIGEYVLQEPSTKEKLSWFNSPLSKSGERGGLLFLKDNESDYSPFS